jgi:hypothetical protein
MNENTCQLAVSKSTQAWNYTWHKTVFELEQKENLFPEETLKATKYLLSLTNNDFRELLYSYCTYHKTKVPDAMEVFILTEFYDLRAQLLDRIFNLPVAYISPFHKIVFLKLINNSIYLSQVNFSDLQSDPMLFTEWELDPEGFYFINVNEDDVDINIKVYEDGQFKINCYCPDINNVMRDSGQNKYLYQYLELITWGNE